MQNRTILGALAVLAAAAGANADIYDYHWSYADTGGGSGTYNRTEMHIFGGDVGVEGTTSFTATAPVGALILFDYNYSCPDGGTWDYAYYQINGGARQIIAYNNDQGSGSVGFTVGGGDSFTLGVYTADGTAGGGFFQVVFGDYGTLVAKGVMDFPWHFYENPDTGDGSGYVAPPYTIHIDGSTNSSPQTDHMFTDVESPVWFYLEGTYSGDQDDEAFWYTNGASEVFGDFQHQGFWSYMNSGLFKGAASYFGLAVATNGAGARGVVDTTNFFSWVYTHQIEDVPWQAATDCGGSVDLGHIGDRYIVITGGDSDVAGATEAYDWEAGTHYLVQATMIYDSVEANGPYDYAYYQINGKKTVVADNDQKGAHPVEFRVNAGDSWGFGVGTTDGMFGPGTLVLDDYRAFPAPFQAHCYADFSGDGVLDLFDFLAYVNAFNAADSSADCDGDNEMNLFDFLCYTNAFNAGC